MRRREHADADLGEGPVDGVEAVVAVAEEKRSFSAKKSGRCGDRGKRRNELRDEEELQVERRGCCGGKKGSQWAWKLTFKSWS